MTHYIELVSLAVNRLNQGDVVALAALFLLLVLGELGVPFPFVFQGVLFFIGYQLSLDTIRVVPLLLILLLGRQLGAGLVYGLSRLLGNPFISWGQRHFRWVREGVAGLRAKFRRRAVLAVAIGRLTPGLLVPTSVASGATGLRYEYFALGVALSGAAWDVTFIAWGALMGHGVRSLNSTVALWLVPSGLAVSTALVWLGGRFLLRRKQAT